MSSSVRGELLDGARFTNSPRRNGYPRRIAKKGDPRDHIDSQDASSLRALRPSPWLVFLPTHVASRQPCIRTPSGMPAPTRAHLVMPTLRR